MLDNETLYDNEKKSKERTKTRDLYRPKLFIRLGDSTLYKKRRNKGENETLLKGGRG